MLELIPKKSIKTRQEERLALEIADDFGSYFEKVTQEDIVLNAITEALTKLNKQNPTLTQLILSAFKERYPTLDFKI